MQLCLVRHAIAADRSGKLEDAHRPLTEKGRTRMEAGARGLAAIFVPEVVLTSPLLRARETAEILVNIYDLGRAVQCDALATGDHLQLLATLAQSDAASAIVVGHEPHLSALLSLLTTGAEDALHVDLKKGSAALVEAKADAEPGQCELRWLIQPATLRALAPA